MQRRSKRLCALAALTSFQLAITHVASAAIIWDNSGTNPTNPTDGGGSWDTTAANWSSGAADAGWVTGNTATIGNNNGPAGVITIDDTSGTVSVAGINFNAAGSGNYTVAANSLDTLTLTSPTVTVNAGSPTISASHNG